MVFTLSSPFILLFLLVFISSLYLTPLWIKRARAAGLVGKDIHKHGDKKVAELGGIVVLVAFLLGITGFIGLRIFYLQANSNIHFILATLSAIFIAAIIGIMDDVLGWKIGLKQWQKPLLTLLVAMPLMAVNAGTRVMGIPFVGVIDFGILYPLLIVPVIIAITSNGFNMLAGYNGLEAGQGILILTTIAFFAYFTDQSWVSVIALSMVFSLAGFLVFNFFPAKIFPGDTMTYSIGALIGVLVVFANLEFLLLILFIPYFAEFLLKFRGLFRKESFASVDSQNLLKLRYTKWYSLPHVVISVLNAFSIKATERRVVLGVHFIQLLFIAFAIILL